MFGPRLDVTEGRRKEKEGKNALDFDGINLAWMARAYTYW